MANLREKRLIRFLPVLGAALVLAACTAYPGGAEAHGFSFRSVEYMPRGQRVPAAQAFVAANITPGMPMPAAESVLRDAGVFCDASPDGGIACSKTSMVAHSDQKSEEDIQWQVRVTPDASGNVSSASVRRVSSGT
jgi:hypothetical protein